MDRLHSMRVFARVVDAGSFAAAARELNQSPAVMTRLVADLEDHLGARLLNRTTRRLALTDVGEAYLERVRAILAEIDEAEALASRSTADPRGHLRVLAPPAFAVHQLAKRLPAFHAQYPHVTVEITSPGPVETVDENHDVSIIMVTKPLAGGEFVARLLARSEVVLVGETEYLNRHGRPAEPEDLLGHSAILPAFIREVNFERRASDGSIERRTVRSPRVALMTSHLDTTYSALLAGLGISGLPSFVVEDALVEHALERILPRWMLLASWIYVAMPTRKHVPARTRAFIDFLVAALGGSDHDPWLAAAGCSTPVR